MTLLQFRKAAQLTPDQEIRVLAPGLGTMLCVLKHDSDVGCPFEDIQNEEVEHFWWVRDKLWVILKGKVE